MKLTSQQLDYIKGFISKRGFTALDLQMEIIDHVACRVEDLRSENPALPFEDAVAQTHREFGIFGFATLEEAMMKSLTQKYRNQFALEFKRWFSFPTIILVAGFAFLLFQLFFMVATNWLIGIFGFTYLVLAVGVTAYQFKLKRRYRKMMIIQVTNSFAFLPTILLQFGGGLSEIPQSDAPLWLQASLFTAIILLFSFLFASFFRVSRFAIRQCQEFEQRYPTVMGGET
ncbi:hypothetical protein [Parapedobacter sp. 2B3]|uniref:hypothetical protein n=1 Tax=Parapedobacter sp. 2B3 TaxID=3342381 RepID=UPI0035B5F1CE